MLNIKNGELQISNMIIAPSLRLGEFLTTPISQDIVSEQSRGELTTLILKPQWLGDTLFNIMLSFFTHTGKLFSVALRISHDGEHPSWSWENWSEDEERRIRGEHDYWLFQLFGKPHEFGHGLYPQVIYNFPWGKVESSCDPRHPQSEICIWYDKMF